MKKLALIPTLAVTLSVAAFAQSDGRERPEPTFDAVTQFLALSDSQIVCLETNKSAAREAVAPSLDELHLLQIQLRQARRNGEDTTAIESQIETLKASIKGLRETYQTTAVGCLDANQSAALAELQTAAELQREVREGAALLLIDGGDRLGIPGRNRRAPRGGR